MYLEKSSIHNIFLKNKYMYGLQLFNIARINV
jgi:hypothetical protein